MLRQAEEEARGLQHSYVGTEHILLALAGGEGVLPRFGVTPVQVRAEVVRMMGRGVEPQTGELPFTARADEALARARREASGRGGEPAGPGDILMALTDERDGAASRILLALDVDRAAIRAALAS